jgi:hypothetical protein
VGGADLLWQLIIAGLVIGALVGLTGMGGGPLMTPLLVLVFGFNPTVAVGTDCSTEPCSSPSVRSTTAASAQCRRV